MKDFLSRIFPGVLTELIVTAIMAIIALLSIALGIEANRETAIWTSLIICLVVLCVATGYIFTAKRQSQIDPNISYPRFGKRPKALVSISLVAAIALVVWISLPYQYPYLTIKITNNSVDPIEILNRAEF